MFSFSLGLLLMANESPPPSQKQNTGLLHPIHMCIDVQQVPPMITFCGNPEPNR